LTILTGNDSVCIECLNAGLQLEFSIDGKIFVIGGRHQKPLAASCIGRADAGADAH